MKVMKLINRLFVIGTLFWIAVALVYVIFWLSSHRVAAQMKKLPEGQTCANTFDTDVTHKCGCMAEMRCPMEKPKPCDDEEGNCDPPANGPDSTKCISPFCKKDACKCANPCKS